jgi:hypothetical protein
MEPTVEEQPTKKNYYDTYKLDPVKAEKYRNNRIHYYYGNQEKEREAARARYYKRKAAKLAEANNQIVS